MMNHIGNLQLLRKKLRTAMMKNCFIENHCNPNAQLTFTWKGIEFYQKHFVVKSFFTFGIGGFKTCQRTNSLIETILDKLLYRSFVQLLNFLYFQNKLMQEYTRLKFIHIYILFSVFKNCCRDQYF